jgi:8-oxo-dGTP pyrophosphatase MutT (NUDIX family)
MSSVTHTLKKLRFLLYYPGLVIYFARTVRARVLVTDGTHVLLVKGRWKIWFDDEQWALPGGGTHRGEAPIEAAVRELREELGLRVSTKQLRLLAKEVVHERGLRYQAHFFVVQIPASTPLKLQVSEIADAQWLNAGTLSPQSLKPEVRQALAAWSASLALVQ